MRPYFFNVGFVIDLIKQAGEAVMDIYHQDFAVYEKDDASPVTEADMTAEKIIFDGLHQMMPDIPVIGEEHVAAGEIGDLTQQYFWLVDPVDGTADFVKKNDEFTINIALIADDAPVFGAVYAPALQAVYYTRTPDQSVMEKAGKTTAIKTRKVPDRGYSVLNSRTHCNEAVIAEMMKDLKIAERKPCGSSLKFCLLAAGEADVYPCCHQTKEWDTAAGHAVLKIAGGEVYKAEDRSVLKYRKQGLLNPRLISFGQKLDE